MFQRFACMLGLTLALSSFAHAELLSNSEPGKMIEKVQTYEKVQTSVRGTSEVLNLVGAEIRTKKIIVHINVYVGEYFKNETTQAIRLSFLRDVDSAKIMEAFKASLEINKVDVKSTSITSFLKAVEKSGEAVKSSKMTVLAFNKDDNTDTLVFEDGKGQSTQVDGPKGLAKDIFSIWLGTPSDDGLIKLQKAIKK